jgi:hypothetical protein
MLDLAGQPDLVVDLRAVEMDLEPDRAGAGVAGLPEGIRQQFQGAVMQQRHEVADGHAHGVQGRRLLTTRQERTVSGRMVLQFGELEPQ